MNSTNSNELLAESSKAYTNKEWLEKFITESNELIEKSEKSILDLENVTDRSETLNFIFGCIHSLKGNAGFLGLSNIELLSMQMETVLDNLRTGKISINQEIISGLFSRLDALKKLVISPDLKSIDFSKILEEDVDVFAKDKVENNDNILESRDTTTDLTKENSNEKPVLIDLSYPQKQIKNRDHKLIKKDELVDNGANQRKDIRVDTSKLDKLFDLVGELITVEIMVTNNPDLHDLELPNFTKAANMMNKITRELQETTVSIRMLPLEGQFNKMKRLVRDLSIKFNKKVNFEISGQETEMDKNIIEEVSDPLVHLLRNSIDHGIESQSERIRKDKKEEGNLKLSAKYDGSEILIIIEDDGAGLDRENILKLAAKKNLLKFSPEKMSDSEVWNIIFEPGFSTADKITEISGRGVGMDVVRRNIEKLRGSIKIESKKDSGTKITLGIPLTLAIMDGMLIKVGDTIYAISLLFIKESFRPEKNDINITMDGLEMVRIRGEVFPVLRLHEVFKKEPKVHDLEKGILIILESNNRKVCLFVDDILNQQQIVVKPLSEYLGRIEGITGCFILPDGGIGLILDVDSLLKR